MELVALLQHLEHLEACTYYCRGNRVAEQVGTRTLAQQVDNLFATSGETTYTATECFTQSTGDDVDLTAEVEFLAHTATSSTYNTCRVALVNHNHSVVFLSQSANLVHRSYVTVHREYTVGYNDTEALLLCFFELLLEVCHISSSVTIANSFAQTHTVDNRSVVQSIRDDSVLGAQQRLEYTTISIETSSVEDGVLGAEVVRNSFFELFVNVLCTADEAYRRHTETTAVHSVFCSLNQTGVVRQTEVVVSAEVEHSFATYLDVGALLAFDNTLGFVKAGFADVGQLLLEMFFNFTVHSVIC